MAMTSWARAPATPTSARPTGEASSWIALDAPVRLVASIGDAQGGEGPASGTTPPARSRQCEAGPSVTVIGERAVEAERGPGDPLVDLVVTGRGLQDGDLARGDLLGQGHLPELADGGDAEVGLPRRARGGRRWPCRPSGPGRREHR